MITIFKIINASSLVYVNSISFCQVYNTRFLEIVTFVNTTLHRDLERLTPRGGVIIWNIFLPKPDVPPAIAANYRQVKVRDDEYCTFIFIFTIGCNIEYCLTPMNLRNLHRLNGRNSLLLNKNRELKRY